MQGMKFVKFAKVHVNALYIMDVVKYCGSWVPFGKLLVKRLVFLNLVSDTENQTHRSV